MMRLKRLGRNMAPLFAVLILVFAVGCVPVPGGVIPTPAPEEGAPVAPGEVAPPSTTELADEANFRLLISDDVNAIGDFESLIVTVSSVGVHKADGDGEWIEPPDIEEELDLVDLQGENAAEIWSGTLPDGEYNKVFVYASDVNGVLTNGDSIDVKLPSDKLHINTHFSIPTPDDSPVSFVFDISVISAGNGAGNGQGSVKYILKPVVSQSGPNQKFTEVRTREKDQEREQERERESEEELDLELLEGDIAPGEEVTLLVSLEDKPVAGAVVEVNGEEIGTTGEDGTISFTIPEDADKLKIQAELDGQEGELEIGFSGAEMEEEQERESEEELDLQLEGDVAPGEEVTLRVTIEGEPVAGAVVEVNGEEIGNTGEDGTISFTIPEDADELDIEAELDGQEGELEIEL